MPAYTPQLNGAQLGAGANTTFTFTEVMGKISIKNSGPGSVAVALGAVVPGAVARGANVNVLDTGQAAAYFPIAATDISVLADAAGAGVDVVGHPLSGTGLEFS
jgi:hypothetical protein